MYKRIGETPLEAILRFKEANPKYKKESMTYAGRLDPLAEGVLLVLSGKELKNKDKYLELPKTYEFEILWGLGTDTFDILGKIIGENDKIPYPSDIKTILKKAKGKIEQFYPVFSSKPVKGKPLFSWARKGRLSEIKIPKHTVEIHDAKYISRRFILGSEIKKEIESKVRLVSGDFRQKEILSIWKRTIGRRTGEKFVIDRFKIKVSSGFYVRQFVNDLAQSLKTSGVTFHINRIKVGRFAL